jgi:hypothetical protein
MLSTGNFNVAKLIENHSGITHAKVIGVQMQMPMAMQVPPPQSVPAQPVPQGALKLGFLQRLAVALRVLITGR